MLNKGYIEDLMYGRRTSKFFGSILQALSVFYRLVVLLRQVLFKVGILRRKRVPQRVISVGNLTLGGTGKTPAVMNIAALLVDHHRHPAVVSRGYGRADESALVVVSDGHQLCADTRTGGDEPVLIGSRLKYVPVVVSGNRVAAALAAYNKFNNDTVILDDGFQHIRLRRDLDIVLINAADPFGNGKLFPAGILREPLSALKRAQVVLITAVDRAQDLEALKRTIRENTGAKIFTSVQVPKELVHIVTGEVKPLTALRGARVLAVAGIARPALFASMLLSLGAVVKVERFFPDHYEYLRSDLAGLFQCMADEKISMIVTTEKDAVRLRRVKPEGIWALRIELNVLEKEEWEAVIVNRG